MIFGIKSRPSGDYADDKRVVGPHVDMMGVRVFFIVICFNFRQCGANVVLWAP